MHEMHEIEEKYKNIKQRGEYVSSIEKFIENLKTRADTARKNRSADKETMRKQFIDMLGFPLNCYCHENYMKEKIGKTNVITEPVTEDGDMIATRYQLEVMPDFWFSGILYEKKEKGDEKNALVIAQHGGGGTSEIVGSLVFNSANYNHMVKRILKKGIIAFAPQLLLWDSNVYGNSGYDRTHIDQTLKQFGGSITALEIFCIMRSIDYFADLDYVDENKIGMAGPSYGGMYTLYTAAADTRIKVALSSIWFQKGAGHYWPDTSHFNQYSLFSTEDVGSLVLPRKLYVELGNRDELFPLEGAVEYVKKLTEKAENENCAASLKTKIFDGGHEFDKADDGVNFFIENLMG